MIKENTRHWLPRQPVVNWWSALLLAFLLIFFAGLNTSGPALVIDRTLPDGTDLLRIDTVRTLKNNRVAATFWFLAVVCVLWSLVSILKSFIARKKK